MNTRVSVLRAGRHVSLLSHRPIPKSSRCYASIADKYQAKLSQRAAAIQGSDALEQLRAKYRQRVKEQTSASPTPTASSTPTPLFKKEDIKKVPKKSPIKSLSSYIDVEKLKLHNPKEISLLWRARFAESEESICAVIPQETYAVMHKTARQNPMFVLPLFRSDQGVEMHFLQWMFPNEETSHLMITSLLEYKTKGEYSRPHTIIAHHSELAENKGLVLMKGDLTDSRSLDPLQATWMLTVLQRFYCPLTSDATSVGRTKILRDFNLGVDLDVDALIAEAKAVPGAGEL